MIAASITLKLMIYDTITAKKENFNNTEYKYGKNKPNIVNKVEQHECESIHLLQHKLFDQLQIIIILNISSEWILCYSQCCLSFIHSIMKYLSDKASKSIICVIFQWIKQHSNNLNDNLVNVNQN